jgi:hypothetical protein
MPDLADKPEMRAVAILEEGKDARTIRTADL